MHKDSDVDSYVGEDPRNYLEFTEIRYEINKLSNPSAESVDFELIKSLCSELFNKNGIDLQTACYFTFAQTRLAGLAGFCEGCNLIAELITQHWETFWPENDTARIEMLDWLNNRIGNDIRSFNFKSVDIPLLLQLEQPLKRITDKLKQLKLKKDTQVISLYLFVLNTRETLEQRIAAQSQHRPKTLLIAEEAPKTQLDKVIEQKNESFLPLSQGSAPIHIHAIPPIQNVNPSIQAPTKNRMLKVWQGFILGLVFASALFLTFIYFQQQQKPAMMDPYLFSPRQQPEMIQYANKIRSAPFYYEQPDLSFYQNQLTELGQYSPLASYYYGDNLTALLYQLWPDSQKAASVRQEWQERLLQQQNKLVLTDDYIQAQKKIAALLKQLNQAETQELSISLGQLKSSLVAIQRHTNNQQSTDELLRQLLVSKSPTPEAMKQFEQRLNSLLSHYHTLTTNKQ